MPYLPPDLQDPRLKQPTLGQALAQGTGATAPIGVAGGGSSAGQVGPQPTPANAGSGFVNLSQYLSANQGAAQKMGADVMSSAYPGPTGPALGEGQPAQSQIDTWNANASKARDALNSSPAAVMDANPAYGGRTEGMKGLDSYLLGGTGMQSQWDASKAALPNYPPLTPENFTPTPYIGAGAPGSDPNAPPQVTQPTTDANGKTPTWGDNNPWLPKQKKNGGY
jgi:hypothetical protein